MSGAYYGDFPTSHTAVCIPFDSFAASTGAPSAVTNFANTDIQIYKDGGVTQRSSAVGITVTTSFDTNTGLQMIVIDLSDNTDAGFYAAGHEYQVAVADITVDAQTLRFWAGCFSIERAGGVLALLKGNAVKVDVNTIKTNPVVNGGTVTFPTNATLASTTNITAGTITTVTTVTNQLTAAAIATGVWTDTTAGDFTVALSVGKSLMNGVSLGTGLTVASVSGAVGSVTGAVGSVAGSVGSVVASVTLTAAYDAAKTAAQAGDAMALTAGERTSLNTVIKTTAIIEAYRANGAAPTEAQFMSEVLAHLGESSISGTTKTINKLDHVTAAETFTLDSAVTPASVTRAT